jgi:hypothetical protein
MGNPYHVLTFYDAAYPPASSPVTDGVCFYIGGDTPHVWTKAEVSAQKARYRLPVFVRSNPESASATKDVTEAVTQLHAIGAPAGILVAWDLESAVDAAYIAAVYRSVKPVGYRLIVYGSQSTVLGNDSPGDLYWGADWTGKAHLHSGDAVTQYVSFSEYDESLALSSLPFWDTQQPTVKPPTTSDWQGKLMKSLQSPVQQGDNGSGVRTVQALCCARGFATAIDGSFGAQTHLAVTGAQKAGKVTADGVVGPETWPVLMGVA